MDPKREIIRAGRILFEMKLAGMKSGNISILRGSKIFITSHGSSLGFLKPSDIVSFSLKGKIPSGASTESIVHQRIYMSTSKKAVIHFHPVYAISISAFLNIFRLPDVEGEYYFPEGVPVLDLEKPFGSEELAKMVAEKARKFNGIIVRRHGAFVFGENLSECLHYADVLERGSAIYFNLSLKGGAR